MIGLSDVLNIYLRFVSLLDRQDLVFEGILTCFIPVVQIAALDSLIAQGGEPLMRLLTLQATSMIHSRMFLILPTISMIHSRMLPDTSNNFNDS